MKKLLSDLYDAVFACGDVCEIRLLAGRPVSVRTRRGQVRLAEICTGARLMDILAVATDHSVYTATAQLVQGYLPYRGGVRLGVAGHFVMRDGRVHSLGTITGMVIRLPHAIEGCSRSLPLGDVFGRNVLVVSPPFGGKTTFLRDLATRLSTRCQVVVIDERGELAAGGELSMGDSLVVDGAPKQAVVSGVVRALNPRYVVCDELDLCSDLQLMQRLSSRGVNVVATLHGDANALRDKPLADVFGVRVLLSAEPQPGHVVEVVYA